MPICFTPYVCTMNLNQPKHNFIMPITLAAFTPYVNVDLAKLIISYITPASSYIYDVVMSGSYELCMSIPNKDLALHYACKGEKLEIVKLLLYRGVGILGLNWALGITCKYGQLELTHLLIAAGADEWDRGLREACGNGHTQLVNLMIHKGATDWETGLRRACKGGYLNIIKLMITMGDELGTLESAENAVMKT